MNYPKVAPAAILLAILLLVTGCASTSQRSSTGEYIDDTVITAKVKSEIFNDSTLRLAEINVETFKGIVQLSGFVSTQANIDRAVELAHRISGVVSVKNDMQLK